MPVLPLCCYGKVDFIDEKKVDFVMKNTRFTKKH